MVKPKASARADARAAEAARQYDAASRKDRLASAWAAVAIVLLATAAGIEWNTRFPGAAEPTVPGVHSVAKCGHALDEKDGRLDLAICRDGAGINAQMLTSILTSAQEGLLTSENKDRFPIGFAADRLATSIAQYYSAVAMRGRNRAVYGAARQYLAKYFQCLACTALVDFPPPDVSDPDGQFVVPSFICTEARYVGCQFSIFPDAPTELVLKLQRVVLLFSLLGSEFHEGTVAYISGAAAPTTNGMYLTRPTFSYDATALYRSTNDDPSIDDMMLLLWNMTSWPTRYEPTVAAIVANVVGNLNRMVQKEVDGYSTWNETFFAAIEGPVDRNLCERAIQTNWQSIVAWISYWNGKLNSGRGVIGILLYANKLNIYFLCLLAMLVRFTRKDPLYFTKHTVVRFLIVYCVSVALSAYSIASYDVKALSVMICVVPSPWIYDGSLMRFLRDVRDGFNYVKRRVYG